MKVKLLNQLIALLVLATSLSVCAQTEKKPLTNADVVQMLKANLAENVIVLSIQSSPANYDTSPSGLIELNKQGVTPKVQEAMLAAQKAGATPGPVSMPSLSRVFLVSGTDRTELKQNKGEFDHIVAPFFAKMFIKFAGKQAEFRIANNSPVFELTLPGNWVASEHVKLLKPDIAKERREIPVRGMAGPGIPINPDKKANVALSIEEIRKDNAPGVEFAVHHVKTTAPLRPGEYVLVVDHIYYCFGVDAAK